MAASPSAQNETGPGGARIIRTVGRTVVIARAGKPGAGPVAAFAIAAIWTVKWGLDLLSLLASGEKSAGADFWPTLFIFSVMTLAGAYCALLCLWTMLGRERLTVEADSLRVTNPWSLGLLTRRFDRRRVTPFLCVGKECGARGDEKGCCCSYSTVDYAFSFGYNGGRVALFTQLSREEKDWLRERLNAEIARGAERIANPVCD